MGTAKVRQMKTQSVYNLESDYLSFLCSKIKIQVSLLWRLKVFYEVFDRAIQSVAELLLKLKYSCQPWADNCFQVYYLQILV